MQKKYERFTKANFEHNSNYDHFHKLMTNGTSYRLYDYFFSILMICTLILSMTSQFDQIYTHLLNVLLGTENYMQIKLHIDSYKSNIRLITG